MYDPIATAMQQIAMTDMTIATTVPNDNGLLSLSFNSLLSLSLPVPGLVVEVESCSASVVLDVALSGGPLEVVVPGESSLVPGLVVEVESGAASVVLVVALSGGPLEVVVPEEPSLVPGLVAEVESDVASVVLVVALSGGTLEVVVPG